jgi:hypothetical protein
MTWFERNLREARENNCLSLSPCFANKLFLLVMGTLQPQAHPLADRIEVSSSGPEYSKQRFNPVCAIARVRPKVCLKVSALSNQNESPEPRRIHRGLAAIPYFFLHLFGLLLLDSKARGLFTCAFLDWTNLLRMLT